jgi:hypothetical protein
MLYGKGLEALHIRILERDILGLLSYTGIAGGAVNLGDLRGAAESVYNGVLTAASSYY